MAYFAEIVDGVVAQVVTLADDVAPTEAEGQEFLTELLGGSWVEWAADLDRGPYPGPGYTWDGTVFADPSLPPVAPDTTGGPDDSE